jgi:hypothetical protein
LTQQIITSFLVDTLQRLAMVEVNHCPARFIHKCAASWMANNLGIWKNDQMLFILVPKQTCGDTANASLTS